MRLKQVVVYVLRHCILYSFADLVQYSWMCPYIRNLRSLGVAVLSGLWLFAAILVDCIRRFLLG